METCFLHQYKNLNVWCIKYKKRNFKLKTSIFQCKKANKSSWNIQNKGMLWVLNPDLRGRSLENGPHHRIDILWTFTKWAYRISPAYVSSILKTSVPQEQWSVIKKCHYCISYWGKKTSLLKVSIYKYSIWLMRRCGALHSHNIQHYVCFQSNNSFLWRVLPAETMRVPNNRNDDYDPDYDYMDYSDDEEDGNVDETESTIDGATTTHRGVAFTVFVTMVSAAMCLARL